MIIAAACVACLLNVNAVLVSVIAGSLTRSAVIVDVIAGNLTRSAVLVAVIAGSLTWSALEIEPAIAARTGHTAVCCPCQFKSHDYNNVLVFGGGDNEGKFFSDLFCISVSTLTSSTRSVQANILKVCDSS